MRYAPTTEQAEFGQIIRSFLQRRAPESGLPEKLATGERFDASLWRDMATQLELPALTVPEALGGSGFGAIERGVVLEELGRSLTAVPYFATAVLALPLIVGADEDGAATTVTRDLAAGRTVGAAALAEPDRTADALPATTATDGRLDGRKSLVLDGDLADVLVVSARVDDAPALFLVRTGDEGVTVRPQRTLDPTRGSAEVELRGCPAIRLDRGGRAADVVREVLTRARVALAAEQVGGAARCLEMAVEHAKSREQFGRPIGSFQAVKHLCAQMLYDLEAARSAAWYGTWALDEAPEELSTVVPTLTYLCSEAYQSAARNCVHILGGIGFTAEHPAQLYFKRATATAQLLGSPPEALTTLAEETLDIPGSPAI